MKNRIKQETTMSSSHQQQHHGQRQREGGGWCLTANHNKVGMEIQERLNEEYNKKQSVSPGLVDYARCCEGMYWNIYA
jgi:hypothetical protein